MIIHERHGNIMKFGYGLGYATIKFFDLRVYGAHVLYTLLSYRVGGGGEDCHIQTPQIPWYLEAIFSQPHDTHDEEDPKPLLSQRGHEMNGRELGILNGIFFVRGSHDWEYGLGLWAQTPWDSLEHLANLANVMSYISYMVFLRYLIINPFLSPFHCHS